MHSKKKYVKKQIMDITTYKKENMYLSQTSNLHSTYTISHA